MRKLFGFRWLVVALSATMLLVFSAACTTTETIEVPGDTVIVEKEVIKEIVVPGETVVVEKVVTETVQVPGETVIKEVIKEVAIPGETVVVEVVREKVITKEVEVAVPVVVEKEVIKIVEVPGKAYVTDPVTGRVYSAPQYGGTITFAKQNDYSNRGTDIAFGGNRGMTSPVIEKVSSADWALDRSLFPFAGGGMTPVFALTDGLATSWELPDDKTFVFHIRPGVKWHNRAPTNGRTLTAEDVVFQYHRLLGNLLEGNEFSEDEKSPVAGALGMFPWDSIEATDDLTMVMKMKSPAPYVALQNILDSNRLGVLSPEVIREKGHAKDWRDLTGTGPFEMEDWIFGENFTYVKNQDYWGVDRKYPDNRIPYINTLKGLVIVEGATRVAGLRSGLLDFVGQPGASQMQSIDSVLSLARTNPELKLYEWSNRSNNSFRLNMEREPFNDIRVRRAIQMALDLPAMTASYFSGYADTTPQAMLSTQWANSGFTTAYEDWPEEIKQYYTYDPEGAGKLLDEAGFPAGDDGVRFKTDFMHFNRWPVAWSELAVAYWAAIGISMDLDTPAAAEHNAKRKAKDYNVMTNTASSKGSPIGQMWRFYSKGPYNPTVVNAEYDAMYETTQTSNSLSEIKELCINMDMMAIENNWIVWGSISPLHNVGQPWIMGYAGEGIMGAGMNHAVFQYLWVDNALKTSMGR